MKESVKIENSLIERPPVVAVMGHIDHGKSALLDYIRKTDVVGSEVGGITQHLSAYEVAHKTKDGHAKKITFLDTPGHEAFCGIRIRGAAVADVAILVVSGEEKVKEQTIDALKCLVESHTPFIVAISKIDKPGVNLDLVRQSLAENEIYVEGYGGNIPCIPISSKSGEGVNELLDMVLLVAEMEELKGNSDDPADGIIIETSLDSRKGVEATIVIKDGTLNVGDFIVCGEAFSPVRSIVDSYGNSVKSASFSSPVSIIGWNMTPEIGNEFKIVKTKREAEKVAEANLAKKQAEKKLREKAIKYSMQTIVPAVIKADASGSLEAIFHELEKLPKDNVVFQVVGSGVGDITEADVKNLAGKGNGVVIGFTVNADERAVAMAERLGVELKTFDLIYKLSEWFNETMIARKPKVAVSEIVGTAKVLKVFSIQKERQIIGGRVETGIFKIGAEVSILRREAEIGKGKVKNLQKLKERADEIQKGGEFGADIESKIEIAPGDRLNAIITTLQ